MLMHKPKLKKLWEMAVKEEGNVNGDIVILKGGEHTKKFKEGLTKYLQKTIDDMDENVEDMIDGLLQG